MLSLSPRRIGIIQVLVSGVGFGFLGIFGKWAFRLGATPGEMLSLRFLLAALIFAPGIALFHPRGWRALRLPPRRLAACCGLGVLGYAVFASFYALALERLSASLTVLLLYAYPALVALGGSAFFGERLGRRAGFALALATIGTFLLVSGDLSASGEGGALGVAYGLLSAVCYAGYILASSRVLRGGGAPTSAAAGAAAGADPLVSAFYVQLSAGVALGLVHLRSHALALGPSILPPILGIAVLSTALAITLFLAGLQKLRASETAILSTAEPVTAILAAWVFLGETLSPLQWLGAVAVLVALARV